jgi:DNA-binding NarL/FixJ family response regulator
MEMPQDQTAVSVRYNSKTHWSQIFMWQHVRLKQKTSDAAERFATLTDRQKQITALVCDGLSNKSIANKLGLSQGTVKSHLHAIYNKLNVQSRIALMIAWTDRVKSKRD